MKPLLTALFTVSFLFSLQLFSQEVTIEDIYPQLKKTDRRQINFKGCVSGNCRSGEGTYLSITTKGSGSKAEYSYYKTTVFVYSGTFYKNGLKLVGKEYGFNTEYRYKNSKAKKMEPIYTTPLDGSNPALNKFLNYEGDFKFKDKKFEREGKGIYHFAIRNHEEIEKLEAKYYNGYKNRQKITFSNTNNPKNYRTFEGWSQPSNAMTLGKLTFQNGDIYQGTFFNNQFEGIGRFTTATGVQEGYWQKGKLVKQEKVTIPNEGLIGIIEHDGRLWIKQSFNELEKEGNYYGGRADKIPNGQGLFFNYWGYTKAGNFSNGKLNGYGLRIANKPKSGSSFPIVHEIGTFENDKLVDGQRTEYKLTSKDYISHTLNTISTKEVKPSSAVESKTATVTEVAITSDDVNKQFQQASDLVAKKEYSKALYILNKIIPKQGYNSQFPMLASFCYMMLKDIPKAEAYAKQAMILNQTDFTNHLMDSYIKTAKNEMDAAKKAMQDAMYFDVNNKLEYYTGDFETMSQEGINSSGAEAMIAYVKANFTSRDKSYQKINNLLNKGTENITSNSSSAQSYFDQAISAGNSSPKPWLTAHLNYYIGGTYYFRGVNDKAQKYLNKAYLESTKHKQTLSHYTHLFIYVSLAEYAANASDWDKVKGLLDNGTPYVRKTSLYANDLKAKYYESWCRFYNATNNSSQMIASANNLKRLKSTGYDFYYEAKALNFLGMGYGLNGTKADRITSRDYYEQALALANKHGFTPIKQDIEANLPIAYWQAGEKTKAIQLYERIIQESTERKDYQGAETSANNLAYLLFFSKDYTKAIKYFRQSVELTEKARLSFKGKDRINYLQGKTSAYQGLIYCLAKLNRVEEVFNAQQKDRARVLLENLGQTSKAKSISLYDYQQTLEPNETAIFYSLFEAGSVIITTVSKNNTSVQVIEQQEAFFDLKAKYLEMVYKGKPGYSPINIKQAQNFANIDDRIGTQFKMNDFNLLMELLRGVIDKSIPTPDDATRIKLINDLMARYHTFLIQPIESKIAGKNKLILYPDGILNFLPFEAVRQVGGKYLVERFDVRYGRSADVSELLRKRTYPDTRKSFLAMGGATYGRMNEHDKVNKRSVNFTDLKVKATQNAFSGNSQREIYASLFGEKMNYLAGTLEEVNNLSQIFTDATVFVGQDMTEKRIKNMSNSKELQNYKIIHLATHGFSLPEFPELSGVAMCIFPNAQNGEDGYLTAPEIAKLDMRADMVVLSACETALGKIYGGEGVAGLTQSILEGGANAAMVSLWPVNDAGTMHFMTGLYELTEKQGKNYQEAINIMKRKFITGEFGNFFKDPQIWAPFVHYGY